MKGSIDGGLCCKYISFSVRIGSFTCNVGDDGNSIRVTILHAITRFKLAIVINVSCSERLAIANISLHIYGEHAGMMFDLEVSPEQISRMLGKVSMC